MTDHLPARVSAGATAVLASLYVQPAWIACLGLLLGACAYQPSESEVGEELSPQNQEFIRKLNQAEQASEDLKTSLKKRCDEMFRNQRLLLGTCVYQLSESEVGGEPSPQNQEFIQKLNQAQQANEDLKTSLKKRCDEMFSNLRIGMRLRDSDPIMRQCAQISYTKTLHNNHEVWTWKDGGGRSVYVDNGVVTTINGTLSSTTKKSGDGVEAP